MENKECLFGWFPGSDKREKGTFIKFSEQVITDDTGKGLQQTMATILKPDGNIVQVEPQCIKIIEASKTK